MTWVAEDRSNREDTGSGDGERRRAPRYSVSFPEFSAGEDREVSSSTQRFPRDARSSRQTSQRRRGLPHLSSVSRKLLHVSKPHFVAGAVLSALLLSLAAVRWKLCLDALLLHRSSSSRFRSGVTARKLGGEGYLPFFLTGPPPSYLDAVSGGDPDPDGLLEPPPPYVDELGQPPPYTRVCLLPFDEPVSSDEDVAAIREEEEPLTRRLQLLEVAMIALAGLTVTMGVSGAGLYFVGRHSMGWGLIGAAAVLAGAALLAVLTHWKTTRDIVRMRREHYGSTVTIPATD